MGISLFVYPGEDVQSVFQLTNTKGLKKGGNMMRLYLLISVKDKKRAGKSSA